MYDYHKFHCGLLRIWGGGEGGRTSYKKHVKKLHSILTYVESSQGFTEIKQVSARSIQVCRGSMLGALLF